RANKSAEALAEVERLLAADARNPSHRGLKAAILSRLGEYDEAIGLYEGLLAEYPDQVKLWLSYGHALKTAGRQADSIEAYRKCTSLAPAYGEAWWSLANLKTFQFDADDLATMRAQLARPNLADDDRLHLDFALGKALEDAAEYPESFRHYAAGNALRLKSTPYAASDTTLRVRRARETFTADFYAAREGWGCPSADPIFIVGLPRSGSTLLEQILASHPLVEGTMELPDIISLVRQLRSRGREEGETYHDELASLSADEVRAFGEEYLARTRIQRKTDRPYFIDKMPNNWAHAGFIRLILPNAKIIDARRHPLACCFSNFKQHFARGQNFTYSLEDIGRYYRDYVELMGHFDAVAPGAIHRVIYERMVDDTEAEVRALLDHCGLPFDPACLRFYENDRAVRTASSEQVRRPIFREGVDQWRHYNDWLDPLRSVLGPVLVNYPAAPGV
ncbi:MAG: sulfotransferase, partial [Gammaproteobacteria bacterium]|nr:sulfotransferase [Gammaproteobacteria bacterium]